MPAAAQLLPRYREIKPVTPAPESNLVERVEAPGAVWAAVNEPARMLAVGHGLLVPHQLSLFVLDEAGRVVTSVPPVRITLPKPASLAAYTNVVAGMATHPTKPLLYVLQDIHTPSPPPLGDPRTNPVFNEFDRLFVYQLDPTNTQLVATLRGERFLYGLMHVSYLTGTPLGIDAANRRLYLPSLRDPSATNAVLGGIGYIELDGDGLPVTRDGAVVAPVVQYTPPTGPPVGMGWVPCGGDAVVYGWWGGLATWDLGNRRAPITAKFCGADWGGMIVGHPTLPILYRTTTHTGRIYAFELVDGFPTLFPQEINIAYSYSPQVLVKRGRLAVGSGNVVYLVRLEPDGRLTAEVTSVPVADFAGTALCYSAVFDRLYAAAGKVAP